MLLKDRFYINQALCMRVDSSINDSTVSPLQWPAKEAENNDDTSATSGRTDGGFVLLWLAGLSAVVFALY